MPARLLFGLLALLCPCSLTLAQLPNPALDFVFPAGGQAGSTLVVQVGGRDLDEGQRLVFSHPGIRGELLTRPPGEFESGPQPLANQFQVSIPLNVPPGPYDVRFVGRFGVSTPRTFVVGSVGEQQEAGDHHAPEQASPLPLNVVANGRTEAGAVDYYRFSAQQGQTLIVECVAQQLEGTLAPVVTIWNAQQQQLARSKQLLDPIVEFVAPETGEYLLGVNDHVFGGGASHIYRLRIHTGPYLIASVPAAAHPGELAQLTIYGQHLPGGETSDDWRLGGLPLQRQKVSLFIPPRSVAEPVVVDPVTAVPDGFVFRWPLGQGDSNGLLVAYAHHPVVAEVEPNSDPDTAQNVSIPCDYSGHFYPRRDQDWVQFTADKGQAYQVRVISHRQGQPTDPELFVQKVVRNPDGKTQVSQVSTEDDYTSDGKRYRQPVRRGLELSHRDPVVRFTADQDGEYRVGLRDLNASSIDDPRFQYRLVIEPQQVDFQLLAWAQQQATDDDKKIDRRSIVLRRGETLPLLIDVLPQGGFNQEVNILVRRLPPGITASECRIAADQSEGILTLTASGDAPSWCGPIEVVGQAVIAGQTVERIAYEAVLTAATGNVEQSRPPARLARQLILAVNAEETAPAELQVAAGEANGSRHWQTSVGAKLAIPLTYIKHGELKGDLALTLVGTPDKVAAEGLTLGPEATTGQLQLNLANAEVKPGTYAIFLRGALKSNYSRNPQALAAVQARRENFEKSLASLDEQVQQTAERLTQARQAAEQRSTQLAQIEGVQTAIGQALDSASQEVAKVNDQLAQLQQGANSAQGEQAAALQRSVQSLHQATTDAAANVQAARDALAEIKDQVSQIRNQLQTAQNEIALAETQHQQAKEKRQRADEYVQVLVAQMAEAQKTFGPAEVTSYVHSPAITLEVFPSPIVGTVATDTLTLRRGETRELPVQIERRFDFAEAVQLALEVPEGVADVLAAPRRIERHQQSGTLQLTAGADAPLGLHTIHVQLSLKFNGVERQERIPLQVTIEE